MGWYLRKSLSAGPIRFNLSKSGIGVSAGVRGARIGVGPRGTYTHVGVGGIYHRQTLSTRSPKTRQRTQVDMITGGDSTKELSAALFDDTQINQNRLGLNFVLKESNRKYWIAFLISIASFFFSSTLKPAQSLLSPLLTLFGLLSLAFIPFEWINRQIKRFKLNRLYKALSKEALANGKLNIDKLGSIISKTKLTDAYNECAFCQFYRDYLKVILEDQVINDAEAAELIEVEKLLRLPEESFKKIRLWAFNRTYLDIISDEILTEKEDSNIERAKEILKLNDDEISSETDTLKVLRAVREIQTNGLAVLGVSFQLDKGEECYHQTRGRFLKEKVVRTYQVSGVRYKEKDFGIEKDGDLYLTSNRIILVGDGVQSIKLGRIFNIETDLDKNLISLNVDKRKSPIQITVPDSYVFSAKLNKLCELYRTLE
jgi:hypothetical protein